MQFRTTIQPGQKIEMLIGHQVRWYVRDSTGVPHPEYWTITGLHAGDIAQSRFDHAEFIAQKRLAEGCASLVELVNSETGLVTAVVEKAE